MKNFIRLFLTVLCAGTGVNLLAQNSNIQLRSTMEWPGQTLANICGWTSPGGNEYALIGGSKGLIIVDVSNPDQPTQIVQIPGPDNLWKEIKTYSHYAYVTSEGGQGVQIVDLAGLPSPTLTYHHYLGDGAINGQLNSIHALHIDVTSGFMYLFGSNLASGGAVVCDLNNDPYNPKYVGSYTDNQYVHDGFADNDTLYAGHIYTGIMAIVDMSDKQNPQVLGTVSTPAEFTHNIWLTDDHRAALTTDETGPSFLASFDVTNPSDIQELDRFQTTPNSGSIVHNTHIRNDWAITSWYTDGFNIVDAHRPINLVQTGRYDTWSGSGQGFDGCWGVFPFFPSGTIVASNIEPAKLFVCSPTYKRACYLEGVITDGCSGQPLAGAEVKINGGDQIGQEITRNNGIFRTGQVTPGTFSVTISKPGYVSKTIDVNLATAQVTELNTTLETNAFTISGTVLSSVDNTPVPNAQVVFTNTNATYNMTSDANGQFEAGCILAGTYSVAVGTWGYKAAQNVTVNANSTVTVSIVPGYYDDFALDYGWTLGSNASSGEWTRGVPQGTDYQGEEANPGSDATQDGNDLCYVTGNGGGGAGSDDVDNGSVTLTSPEMKLSGYADAKLTFRYWFFNDGGQGGAPNDKLDVLLTNGTQTVTIRTITNSVSQWQYSGDIFLGSLLPLTDKMQVIFRASDDAPGHLVEAAVDIFEVTPLASSGASILDKSLIVNVSPNPSSDEFVVRYEFPGAQNTRLFVTNALGEVVFEKWLNTNTGIERLGSELPAGVYFVNLEKDGKRSLPIKAVKQ